jgi:adenine-specific DNA-methyltransferase
LEKSIPTNPTPFNSPFGLNWEFELTNQADDLKISLKQDHAKTLLSDANKPIHWLIEGENALSLRALKQLYAGQVDLIYIDPPYNTGFKQDQEGFNYHDARREMHHDYSHSSWLNFMYERLKLAYELMTETGFLFISIDENEFAHLKLLCDQLFGEKNFVNYLVWKKRSTGGQVRDGSIITQTEFVFIYAKNKAKGKLNKLPNERAGNHKWRDFRKSGGQWQQRYRPKQHFPFYWDEATGELLLERTAQNQIEIIPQDAKGEPGFWENGKDTAAIRLANGELKTTKSKTGQYKIVQLEVAQETQNAGNFIDIPSVQGNHEIKEFDLSFNNVKPLGLLEHIIALGSQPDGLVLDFFAGSGSTAHAVMKMNATLNHQRRCILCTNNEYDLCRSVTYPRLSRAITGYTNSKGKVLPALGENLELFKVEI